MNSIATKAVRDLAIEIPGATRVFENLGIDYCCGGDRTLEDACDIAGVTVEHVMTSLEQVNGSHALTPASLLKSWTIQRGVSHSEVLKTSRSEAPPGPAGKQ